MRFILWVPCEQLATIAVNSVLKGFTGKSQIIPYIVKLAIALAVTNLAAEYLKQNIQLSFVGVSLVFALVQTVIIVYQFGKNKVIWVVEFIKNK